MKKLAVTETVRHIIANDMIHCQKHKHERIHRYMMIPFGELWHRGHTRVKDTKGKVNADKAKKEWKCIIDKYTRRNASNRGVYKENTTII